MELESRRSIAEPDDLSQFDFLSFAQDNFQNEQVFRFSRAPLSEPLLNIENKEDRMASCAISVAILRFTRDMPEPKVSEDDFVNSEEREMTKVNRKAYSFGTTFKRKIASLKANRGFLTSHDVPPLTTMNRPTTNIEKITFITSFGMRNPRLRDEIYCQICRQLTDNVSKTSSARGWILLALCLSVFSPSDKLLNYLRNFLKRGPDGFGEYCYKILQRTLEVDCRRQRPSTIELAAVKNRSYPTITVTFMDGSTKSFEVDHGTTCGELCQMIKEKLGLKSVFGFSIYVASLEQVANWGCGAESVLDAVSLAEQYACTKNIGDSDAWNLYFRKDLFEPVVIPAGDTVATNLIYHQIIGGVRAGEYLCRKQEDLIGIIAKRYYIENGPDMDEGFLRKLIKESVPPPLDQSAEDELFSKVTAAFYVNDRIQDRADSHYIKEDIVLYAGTTWFTEFSRTFDGFVSSGPKLPRVAITLAINSRGILVFKKENDEDLPLLGLDFSQMKKVESIRKGMYLDPILVVATNHSTYSFRCVYADDICDLLNNLIELDSNGNA